MKSLNMRDSFFQISPQVDAANKLLPVGDLILLMPQTYAKLEPQKREGFYGFKALNEDYQSLVRDEVNEAFEQTYQQDKERWRGEFISVLREKLAACDEEDERDRLGRIISVFESVIAENYLPK